MNQADYLTSNSGKPVLTPQKYWAFIPNPLPPNIVLSPELILVLSKADRALASLDSAGRNLPNSALMTKPFIRSEAVLSSRIEGTKGTLEDLYKYEAVQMTYLEPHSDTKDIYNYVVALDYGIARLVSLPISLRLIKELHEKLMFGISAGHLTPGEFRRSQNWIGPAGSTLNNAPFVPPPVDEMHRGLDQLEKFIHTEPRLPALINIALIHYQFEAIHPFIDGNGRVGRLLIALLMHAWDLLSAPTLYLSAYFETTRQAYYDHLLAVSQQGKWDEWVLYFLEGVRSQALNGSALLEKLETLRGSLRKRVSAERSVSNLYALVDFILGNPIISIRQVQAGIDLREYKTAQRSVEKLEKLGILREITGRARNRLYQADEIMKLINSNQILE